MLTNSIHIRLRNVWLYVDLRQLFCLRGRSSVCKLPWDVLWLMMHLWYQHIIGFQYDSISAPCCHLCNALIPSLVNASFRKRCEREGDEVGLSISLICSCCGDQPTLEWELSCKQIFTSLYMDFVGCFLKCSALMANHLHPPELLDDLCSFFHSVKG